jgi:thiol-disulfide isomerase/thioredoxin
MIGNLTARHIIIIIIAIIVVLLLVKWLTSKPSTGKYMYSYGYRRPPKNPTTQPESPFILYYFYSPTCDHCKQFSPVWNELVNALQNTKNITIRAVDATKPENENLAFYYNVTGYPTVVLVTPDKKSIEYTGDRSYNDLYQFVESNLSKY